MPKNRALLGWMRIDRKGSVPLHRQIVQQLFAAISDGRLPPGTVLPSARSLATELGLARGTTSLAYDTLVGDGLIEIRDRSLTLVSEVPRPRVHDATQSLDVGSPHEPCDEAMDDDPPPYAAFITGTPAFDIFPAMRWARLLSKRSLQMSQDLADNDFHVGGYLPLRAALASHLRTSRGIECEPEQVVVTSSARAALAALCQVLTKQGDRCLVEDPGYPIARRIMADFGLVAVPVPVDSMGIRVESSIPDAELAYVTPTYQMPLGVRLSDHRCTLLVDWARRVDAWVIEDDYDSEFRYAGEAIAALQSSDSNGRVLHVGTFSKTLFPSLRTAYIVVPKGLAESVAKAVFLHGREPALHLQTALADFIAAGHYAAHIRRARSIYRRRQTLLVNAMNSYLKGLVEIPQPTGGMHVIVPLPAGIPAREVQAAAARIKLHARSISYYAVDPASAPNALILGFATLPDRTIEPAVRRLANVIRAFPLAH